MLNPEAAKERLQAFSVSNVETRIATTSLTDDLQTVCYGLLSRDAQGKPLGYPESHKVLQEAQQTFAALSDADRQTVFSALFPGIARYVEAAWQLHRRLPYQTGYVRKPFRTPDLSPETVGARRNWLQALIGIALPFGHQPVSWFATWASYLGGYQGDALGILLGAAIDEGDAEGAEVFDILLASARGEHEIGAMGRHVTRALLVASRADGWEFVEKLLLAAQRQEGLRQAILEAIDEAHPAAFRRMLMLIREHDLIRFSATIRAVDVWLGFGWDAMSARFASGALAQIETFLSDTAARDAVLATGDPQTAYLALWATAFMDAPAAVSLAQMLLSDPCAERRFIAVHLLTQLDLPAARQALLPALDDPDLRIALRALQADVHSHAGGSGLEGPAVFEQLEALLARMPAKARVLEPIVWDWTALSADRTQPADALLRHLGARPPRHLLPHLGAMSSYGRAASVETLGKAAADSDVRDALLGLVGDAAEYVREKALRAVTQVKLTADESKQMEGLLTRKAGDLRRGVLSLLLAQPDGETRSSAERLLTHKDPLPRQAGLELLQQMVKADRDTTGCRAVAAAYRAKAAKATEAENAVLDALLDVAREEPTLENGLGLFDPTLCSPRVPPAKPKKLLGLIPQKPEPLVTPAAVACLQSLDDLIHAHREVAIKAEGRDEVLLGNMMWGFPSPKTGAPLEDDLARLPLCEVWAEWEQSRPAAQRDKGGLELVRAQAAFNSYVSPFGWRGQDNEAPWLVKAREILFADALVTKLRHSNVVNAILPWLLRLKPPSGAADMLLDAVETTVSLLPEEACGTQHGLPLGWLGLARRHRAESPAEWTSERHVRLWNLVHWLDSDKPGATRSRPPFEELLTVHDAGVANEADLFDQLIGPRPVQGSIRYQFPELALLTARRPAPIAETHPILRTLADRCRARILEVELQRGELPTAASAPALALRSVEGVAALVSLLGALGSESLLRGRHYGWWSAEGLTKGAVFCHLIRVSFPASSDTPEGFAAHVQAAKINSQRLIELAVYAPQWAGFVQHALGWPEFAEAVWWLHAHTKDTQWTVDSEVRELWVAQASERTPLSGQSLLDGAVDVAWFHRIYGALGAERWTKVDEAAKYASGGAGHKRAQLFANAMLGRVTKEDLLGRITQKRNPDAVRALGLVPLTGGAGRDADVLDRYKTMQEFLRSGRQFGAMRQASEKTAVGVGLENLARTAGYPDPVRLEWAMEAQAVQDLAQGPVSVAEGDVTVALAINEWGGPVLSVTKKDRVLKSIPPTVKKAPAVAALCARKIEIERQASRMRLSLEGAMCRGDVFTGEELRRLMAHPVLSPMLRALVLVGETDGLAGYPVGLGLCLEGVDGTTQPLAPADRVRIAHPHDLFRQGQWHAWQRECFLRERIQPFKQVFRELYVLADAERNDGTGHGSRRYAGHQVNRAKAFALLGKRGWVGNPYEGDARRTFHEEGLTASVGFDFGYTTPAEVEGLTIDQVVFTKRGEWKPLDLALVPPRLFSEAMRDLDLVVSVAHQGGVDPEASASTVEMRAALLREACALMKLGNVRLQSAHALIDGHLGVYSVHLGSAVVHRQPGGHLCIVPVHSQHRGRLFLPFADDDPRTAEVLSKVLLLARDTEIKDPTILEQIMA